MHRGEARPGNTESTRTAWRKRFEFQSFKEKRLG